MDLVLDLNSSNSLVWVDVSGRSLGLLEAAATKEISLTAVPLATGLHVSTLFVRFVKFLREKL
jgi:hypothetical protein